VEWRRRHSTKAALSPLVSGEIKDIEAPMYILPRTIRKDDWEQKSGRRGKKISPEWAKVMEVKSKVPKSQGYKMAHVDQEVHRMPPELSKRIQSILKREKWPTSFHQKKRPYVKAERLNIGCELDYEFRDGLQFIADELPYSLACITRVLKEVKQRMPDFQPWYVLDFGSGPGTGIFACHDIFGPLVKKYFIVEPSNIMKKLSKELLQNYPELPPVRYLHDLDHPKAGKKSLTLSAFTLLEIPTKERREEILDKLWESTNHTLVMLEGGSRDSFDALFHAREYLLTKYPPSAERKKDSGCYVVAPCSHDGACPIGTKDRCIFKQRLGRNELPGRSSLFPNKIISKRSKSFSRSPLETTITFSYLVLRKGPSPRMRQYQALDEDDSVADDDVCEGKDSSDDVPSLRSLAYKLKGLARETSMDWPDLMTNREAAWKAFNWPRIVAAPNKQPKKLTYVRICRPLRPGELELLQAGENRPGQNPSTPYYSRSDEAVIEDMEFHKHDSHQKGIFKAAKRMKWGDLWYHMDHRRTRSDQIDWRADRDDWIRSWSQVGRTFNNLYRTLQVD